MENFLKAISSICPECHAVIPGKLSEEAGMVVMSKSCPHYGEYKDLYWSDFDQWQRARKYAVLGDGARYVSPPRA